MLDGFIDTQRRRNWQGEYADYVEEAKVSLLAWWKDTSPTRIKREKE